MCLQSHTDRVGKNAFSSHLRSNSDPRVYAPAVTKDRSICPSIQRSKLKNMPERSLIGIDGKWYDITVFKKYHPGGDIIEEFVGMDATQIFHAWHPPSVLSKRKPVGTYDMQELAPQALDPFEKDMRSLQVRLREEGYFDCDKWWLSKKMAVVFILFLVAQVCVWSPNPVIRYGFGVIAFTLFLQQSGFMMHDAMHSQHFEKYSTNQKQGVFFGSVCFGISSGWWRDEHYEHHSFTCTIEPECAVSDPQFDDVWVPHKKYFPFRLSLENKMVAAIQDYAWIPLIFIAGRILIMIDSYRDERRLKEWAALALHYGLVVMPAFMAFSTVVDFLIWYVLVSVLEGVLHVQLVISHLATPFQFKKDSKKMGWHRWQIMTTYNITNPRWLDWFHGGLNFHMIHHMWPNMPRLHYARTQKLVDKICEKHGVKMNKASFFELLEICTENFRQTKKGYFQFLKELDFRG